MALDYTKWSDADLEALAKNDYSKLSDQALQELSTHEAGVAQGGQPGLANQAAELGGQAISAVGDVVKPIAETVYQHPIATALGASYLPENIAKYIPVARHLPEFRRNVTDLAKDILNRGNTPPPGTGPGGPFSSEPPPASSGQPGVKIPINQPFTPPTATNPNMPGAPVPATPQPPPNTPTTANDFISKMAQLAQQYAPVAGRVARVGIPAMLGTYSKGLNTGEEEALKRIREQQGIR